MAKLVFGPFDSGFYNEATDALLNQYGTEVSAIKGSSTWKSIIVYINMLRAIGKSNYQFRISTIDGTCLKVS